VFPAQKHAKTVAALLNVEAQAFSGVSVVKLFARCAELTPTFFLYDDIATPAGPIVR
jgi:hypothetical protein